MANEIATYLKFANVQMAAEALLDRVANLNDPKQFADGLISGNNRASKFIDSLAAQFTDPQTGWTVVAHQPDTATGFSGTLFKNNATNELVLSFRSTEFIDEAVRDNQATNAMDIRPFGWAFGQISDMSSWVNVLVAGGKISTPSLTVTG